MASASTVAMATLPSAGSVHRPLNSASVSGFTTFFNPMRLPARSGVTVTVVVRTCSALNKRVMASTKEKAVSGLTAAVATAMVIPNVAEAAGSDVSASLNNFLLSDVAGGMVLGAIVCTVIVVSNFDPIKRS